MDDISNDIRMIVDFLIENCTKSTVFVVDNSITLLNYINITFTGFNISRKIAPLSEKKIQISVTDDVVQSFIQRDEQKKDT